MLKYDSKGLLALKAKLCLKESVFVELKLKNNSYLKIIT